MSKELVISAASHERRVAILEEGQLVEIYIEREKEFALVGSIYKGKVTRVLPGMQSAFVDIGLDGDAFLYVSDVFENLEDHDHLQPHEEHDQPPPLPPAIGSTVEVLPGETLARASERHDQVHHEEFPTRAASDQGQASPEMPHGASEAQHFEEQPGGDQLTPREDHLAQAAEERQPDSNASAPQKFSTQYNPTQNYSNRSGNDRQGQNYGRSGDRGRWGRRGGRQRGGRQQGGPGGRNLPPSKYTSPQSGEFRGYDSRGGQQRGGYDNRRQEGPRSSASSSADITEETMLLPGESLAKYRGKPVAAQSPVPSVEQESRDESPSHDEISPRPASSLPNAPSGAGSVPRRFSGGLPSWLLADAATETEAPSSTGAKETEAPEAPTAHKAEPVHGDADLNEDQVDALAADLVEAKHEEATAEAEADALVGGAVFEEDDTEEETEAAAETHAEEVSGLTEEETAEVEAGRAADRVD